MPTETPTYSRLGNIPKPAYTPPTTTKPKKKTTLLEIILFGVFALLLILGGFAIYSHFSPSYDDVPNLVADGFQHDRINLLVIGIGGDSHPGGGKDLADSIMFVSLKPSTKQVALVSVPRDFYLNIGHYGVHRINAAHDLGYQNSYPGRGPGLLVDTVKEITGQPIHAYARIDFAAFEKIIDELGGVDIYVYRPFHDFLFKDGFEQGWQHMNGKRALQYARYRYVHGAEGNNFARELRQQQVVTAMRQKLQHLPPQQVLRLVGVASTVSKYTATNLTPGQIVKLYTTFKDVKPANIRHVSLAPLTEVFMVSTPGDSGEAVRPRGGNYTPIRQMAANIFSDMRPLVNHDQIQLAEGEAPKPAEVAGDDTLVRKQRAAAATKPSAQTTTRASAVAQ